MKKLLALWLLVGLGLIAAPARAQDFSFTEIAILKSLSNRACADGEVPVWVIATERWSCGAGGGGGGTDDQIASEVPFTPSGNIIATDVDAAIRELDTEKLSTSGTAALATALAATPTKCSAGLAAGGVDASGNAVDCTDYVLESAIPECSNATTDKLLYNATTDTFTCGSDQTDSGGTGITSLNALTGSSQTFADVDDTNVTLTIGSAGTAHTFTIGWAGTLAKARQHAQTAYYDDATPTFTNTITGTTTGNQPLDAELTAIAGLISAADQVPYFTGAGTASLATFTAYARTLVDDADAATARTTLGLGSISIQNASNVSISGGSITGITDLAIADGGTAASTASGARTNLGLAIGTDVQAFDAELSALATTVSAADTLPYYTGPGTASTTGLSVFARTLLDDANAATARTTLGVAIGLDVQAFDAELAAIAGLTSAADRLPYFTGLGTASLATFSAFARTLLDDATAADARTTLSAQTLDAELTALAGLTSAADKVPYFTGVGTAAVADFTAYGRSIVATASEGAFRALVNLEAADIVAAVVAAGLDAAVITSGAFADARIPDLNLLSTGLTASRCVQTDGTGLLSVAADVCGAGGGSSTLREVDLTPSFTATTIEFDQADGFVVTDQTGGVGRVEFNSAVLALAASQITSGQLALARGGTNADLSATGGAGQYLKQVSAGAAITVGTIPSADIPSLDAGKITTGTFATSRIDATGNYNFTGLLSTPIAIIALPAAGTPGRERWVNDATGFSCTVDGGSTLVKCYDNGTNWQPSFVSITTPTLDQVFDQGKIIDGANSPANAFQAGGGSDGTKRWLIYVDSTNQFIIEPNVAANTQTRIMTDMTWSLHSVEAAADVMIADPDALGAGSGTLTIQTGHQLIASNLGVYFNESDTNPACGAGDYGMYADLSETKLKKCENGIVADVGAGSAVSLHTFKPRNNEPPATAFATLDTRNSHPVLDFDDTTAESAVFSDNFNRGYSGANTTVDLKFSCTATTGNVKWNVAWESLASQDMDADSFGAVQTATTACNATSGILATSSIVFTSAQIDGVVAGTAFRLKVTRDASNAGDTAIGDAELRIVEVRQ